MKILINNKEQDTIKAIQVDDYWVVVDTKDTYYQKNKFVYSLNGGIGFLDRDNEKSYVIKNNTSDICYEFTYTDSWYKIIASTKFIDKSIPVIKFVEKSVNELAKEYQNSWGKFEKTEESYYAFIEGFNQAKSSDKKYTEKQLEDAIIMAFDISEFGIFRISRDKYKNRIIQSINESKLPDVINLEMEDSKLKTKSTPEGEVIEIKV
jgi:hypothetical protein